MDEATSGRVEVEAILATDQRVEAYGGFRLTLENLHQLARQAMQPGAEMLVEHDRSRPLNASNVQAEVRWNERGWNEVVVHFEADAMAWAEFEAQKAAAGAPGGMSFTTTAPLAKGGTGDRPIVTIAADAHHFSPADLEEAGMHLLPVVDVELEELFQFSAEPIAKVLIEYGFEVMQSIPADMLASLIYDLLKGLIGKRRASGGKTTVDFCVTETAGARVIRATVTTDSEAVALRAVEALGELRDGRYQWNGEDGPYVPV